MKIKSVSSITCYVKNLRKTEEFYTVLGFDVRTREGDRIAAYSNWFSMNFVVTGKDERSRSMTVTSAQNKASGMYVYLSVDDVDAFYDMLIEHGLKPAGKPRDTAAGLREFTIRDPDGYNIVLFKKK